MNADPAKKIEAGSDARKNWREINKHTEHLAKLERRLQRLELLNERRLIKNGGTNQDCPYG